MHIYTNWSSNWGDCSICTRRLDEKTRKYGFVFWWFACWLINIQLESDSGNRLNLGQIWSIFICCLGLKSPKFENGDDTNSKQNTQKRDWKGKGTCFCPLNEVKQLGCLSQKPNKLFGMGILIIISIDPYQFPISMAISCFDLSLEFESWWISPTKI